MGATTLDTVQPVSRTRRWKFIIGTTVILAAVAYLIITGTTQNAQYFLTVEELVARQDTLGDRIVRVSGAVVGDTIRYDTNTLELTFTIAHMPGDPEEIDAAGGLAEALREAVANPNNPRIKVRYVGPKPDLLRPEAAAILTGRMGEDGVFQAQEVLFKCPTRYEEAPKAPADMSGG